MIVGFTGTQQTITFAQRRQIVDMAQMFDEFHEGDCIGADATCAVLVKQENPGCKVVSHPPANPSKRAYAPADEVRQPKPYIERNHDIVDECDILIATPKGFKEERRSGTWATIRYAKKVSKPIIIVFPDGTFAEYNT